MSGRLIIGYDGSERGDDALALGALLAERLGARPVVATVIPFPYRDHLRDGDTLEVAWRRGAERILAAARARLGGLEADMEVIDDDFPARALRELAEEVDPIIVVLGSAHRGRLGHLLVGSVGSALLSDAPCPVAIAPQGYAEHGTVVDADADPRPQARPAPRRGRSRGFRPRRGAPARRESRS